MFSREAFEQFFTDWVHFGMAYLERRNSVLGIAMTLTPPLAKYMRRGVVPGMSFQVGGWKDEHEFAAGTVFQPREADVGQEIYGMPAWLAALQSALLNESATLFRRKYDNNGPHAGFIFFLSDPRVSDDDVIALRESLKGARGPGNFKNLFLHSPNGKKDGLQLIPVSEVAARDEFTGIKSTTRDDVFASLRIPPQLLGVVPQNAGGFGSIRDAFNVWGQTELASLQSRMTRVNEWVGKSSSASSPSTYPASGTRPDGIAPQHSPRRLRQAARPRRQLHRAADQVPTLRNAQSHEGREPPLRSPRAIRKSFLP